MKFERARFGFARGGCHALLGAVVLLALAACEPRGEATPVAATPPPPPPAAPPAPAPQAQPVAAQQPAEPPLPPPVVVKDVGLQTPESVLYVPDEDVYLVSNINGKPDAHDKNGFISKVSPDGKVLELKWIDGSKPNSTLSAPKGMTISGDLLFVTDINSVRMFDRKTGDARGRVAVGGATFLNDATTAPDGTVYVSDSGMKLGKEGFEGTKSDGIFKIGSRREAEKVIKSTDLNRPNGLWADEGGVWAVTFAGKELYHVSNDGKIGQRQALPQGSLDGLVRLGDGSFLISSWDAKSIFRGRPGGTFEPVATNLDGPADIGFDSKRNRVLVPKFNENAIEFHSIRMASTAAAQAPASAAPPAAAPPAAPPAQAAKTAPAKVPAPATKTPSSSAAPASPAQPASKAAAPAPAAQPAAPTPAPAAQPAPPAKPAAPAKPTARPAPPAAKPAPAAPPAKAAPPAPAPQPAPAQPKK